MRFVGTPEKIINGERIAPCELIAASGLVITDPMKSPIEVETTNNDVTASPSSSTKPTKRFSLFSAKSLFQKLTSPSNASSSSSPSKYFPVIPPSSASSSVNSSSVLLSDTKQLQSSNFFKPVDFLVATASLDEGGLLKIAALPPGVLFDEKLCTRLIGKNTMQSKYLLTEVWKKKR